MFRQASLLAISYSEICTRGLTPLSSTLVMVLDCEERVANQVVVRRWQDSNKINLVGAMESRFLSPSPHSRLRRSRIFYNEFRSFNTQTAEPGRLLTVPFVCFANSSCVLSTLHISLLY